jgi:hypothetical protein
MEPILASDVNAEHSIDPAKKKKAKAKKALQ